MCKFSIIIPVYNKQAYIRDCLSSVLSQTYTNYEVIVVNDGSTDNSENIILEFDDRRVRYISKENGGVSSARNRGIIESKGEWITFMDADDIMYPNALQVYLQLINKYRTVNFVVACTDQTNKLYPKRNKDYIVKDYILKDAISYAKTGFSLIHTDCICINRTYLLRIGLFNESYTHGEDLDLWERLSEHSTFAKSEMPVALYNQNTLNNSSNTPPNLRKHAPVAIYTHPRSYFKTYPQRLRQGGTIFFKTFPSIFKKPDKNKLHLLFKYFDWVTIFGCYTIYYRLIKRR